MNFTQSPRRPRAESIVPMINVVFLLLIFFLMTAQIAPPEPFEIAPPEARVEGTPDGTLVLYVSKAGEYGFRSLRGEPALIALIEETATGPLVLRVDAQLPGTLLTQLLTRLRKDGIADIDLVVEGS